MSGIDKDANDGEPVLLKHERSIPATVAFVRDIFISIILGSLAGVGVATVGGTIDGSIVLAGYVAVIFTLLQNNIQQLCGLPDRDPMEFRLWKSRYFTACELERVRRRGWHVTPANVSWLLALAFALLLFSTFGWNLWFGSLSPGSSKVYVGMLVAQVAVFYPFTLTTYKLMVYCRPQPRWPFTKSVRN